MKDFLVLKDFCFHFITRIVTIWTEEKDKLMREMAAQGIFQYKTGIRERGNLWEVIAIKDKTKNAEELRATGAGSDDEQEVYEQLLEELAHLSDESDKQADEEAKAAKTKINKGREVALDIRKKVMETMGHIKEKCLRLGRSMGSGY